MSARGNSSLGPDSSAVVSNRLGIFETDRGLPLGCIRASRFDAADEMELTSAERRLYRQVESVHSLSMNCSELYPIRRPVSQNPSGWNKVQGSLDRPNCRRALSLAVTHDLRVRLAHFPVCQSKILEIDHAKSNCGFPVIPWHSRASSNRTNRFRTMLIRRLSNASYTPAAQRGCPGRRE